MDRSGLRRLRFNGSENGPDPAGLGRVATFLVQYLTETTPEIKEDFDTVVDRARDIIRRRTRGED